MVYATAELGDKRRPTRLNGRLFWSAIQHTMEYWDEFQKFEFANETLMVIGGLLLLFAIYQIIKSSVALVFWVVVGALGAVSALYGHDRSAIRLPSNLAEEARNIAGSGGLTDGMMQALCLKLISEESASLSSEWTGLQTLEHPAGLEDVVALPLVR